MDFDMASDSPNPMEEPTMTNEEIIRAWKDESYRNGMSVTQRAQIPDHPSGLVQLSDEELTEAAGGTVSFAACVQLAMAIVQAAQDLAERAREI